MGKNAVSLPLISHPIDTLFFCTTLSTLTPSYWIIQHITHVPAFVLTCSVRGGVDYKLTGEVRRIEVENLKKRLEAGM